MRYDKEDLQAALRVLRQGGIIGYPTDTVWGIGWDATNPEAVARIYALKKREDSKSMLVLLDSAAKLDYYVDVPESAEMLLDSVCEKDIPSGKEDSTSESNCSPAKPLTIIYSFSSVIKGKSYNIYKFISGIIIFKMITSFFSYATFY